MLTVQIDVDHTANAAPEFFSWLTKALRRDGHRVLIVTDRETSRENDAATAAELREMGIEWDELILSPALRDLDSRRFPPGLPVAHRVFVNKLIVAEDHAVDVVFDDDGVVADLFRLHLPEVSVFRPQRR
jgi:hypothetical protein